MRRRLRSPLLPICALALGLVTGAALAEADDAGDASKTPDVSAAMPSRKAAPNGGPRLDLIGDAPRPSISQTSPSRAPPPAEAATVMPPTTEWIDRVSSGEERDAYRRLLFEAHEQELAADFEAAAKSFEVLATRFDTASVPAWRAARAWWRATDMIPEDDVEARAACLDRSEAWARKGIERDPDCAECMLWRYAALGRLATVRGLLSAARNARTMKNLLNTGIDLKPTQTEGPHNSTLGNLYYASAVFNRMVPDSWWVRLLAGVRGDKERALDDIREAVALHPARVDYRVEMGAVLLCLGTSKDRPDAVSEGRHVLEEAGELERLLPTDALDLEYARIMTERPELSCGFSRDGFVDVEGAAGKL